MKPGYWFTLCIGCFLCLMFAVEYSLPKKFVWTPTFAHADRQPFGCALFDELVMDACPIDSNYLQAETFYQLAGDTTRCRSVLAVAKYLDLKRPDVNALLDMANRGSRILLASQSFGKVLADTLGFQCIDSYFNINQLRQYASSVMQQRDTLFWVADSARLANAPARYQSHYFLFYPQLCGSYFDKYDSSATVLSIKSIREDESRYANDSLSVSAQAGDSTKEHYSSASAQAGDSSKKEHLPASAQVGDSSKKEHLPASTQVGDSSKKEHLPASTVTRDSIGSFRHRTPAVALSYRIGQGEIILVSTPLLFTNYGVTDGRNAAYVFRLLSRLDSLPLHRTQAYGINDQEQSSPLRYFLSQPALRWALYVAVITLVLFISFTARRRQRAIPIIRKPENRTLEFAQLIGTLYYQRRDHADLVAKHFCYFSETLRRIAQLDAEDPADDETLTHRLAHKTGMDEPPIRQLFAELRTVIAGNRTVTEEQMKHYIDRMNELTNHLSLSQSSAMADSGAPYSHKPITT